MCRRVSCLLWTVILFVSTAAWADQALWEKYMDQCRVLRHQGAWAGAEKAALAAMAEAEKSGQEDSRLAKSWNDLATIYYDTGRYADAEKFFQRASRLWDGLHGP